MSETGPKFYTIARFETVAPWDLLAKSCELPLSTALIYSRDACRLARIDKGKCLVLEKGEEAPANLASAYEIRAFGPTAELCWTRDGSTGAAIMVADGEIDIPGADEVTTRPVLAVLKRIYRLWGEKIEDNRADQRWTVLGSARIGKLHVPCEPPQTGVELQLVACEYVVRHESGNAVVLFERLVGFAPAKSD